jgi:hypothetical protein
MQFVPQGYTMVYARLGYSTIECGGYKEKYGTILCTAKDFRRDFAVRGQIRDTLKSKVSLISEIEPEHQTMTKYFKIDTGIKLVSNLGLISNPSKTFTNH